jgi:glycosyltransferase involved in cell wall biosynthesis
MRSPVSLRQPAKGKIAFLLWFLTSCRYLAVIIRRERIQIVNAHYFLDTWMYLFFLRRFMPIKLVLSVHGSDLLGRVGTKNWAALLRNSRLIDRIIFCSAGFRRQVLSEDSHLFGKTEVILNGIELAPERKALPVESRRNAITCVAHLRHHKAQDILLRAFERLAREFPALQLELVGEGPLRGELERSIASLNLGERVKIRGAISHREALEAIRTARVFCLPSRREPFGLVLVEAMSFGTPVVATATGGIPEIIRDGIDGLLVEPDDADGLAKALGKVLGEGEVRRKLVESAAARAKEHFTLERFGADYRDCFSRVAEKTSE